MAASSVISLTQSLPHSHPPHTLSPSLTSTLLTHSYWRDGHTTGHTMPYLIVRESFINTSCMVDGLPLNEIRLITEKSSSPSDLRDEKNRRVEFSTPAYNLLNALEQIGYKVVTSSSFITGPKKFDTKDFIWTLYRPSCEIEM